MIGKMFTKYNKTSDKLRNEYFRYFWWICTIFNQRNPLCCLNKSTFFMQDNMTRPAFTAFFCCNAALRITRGSPYVCPSVSFSFFCHLLKKSSGNPYLKICYLMQYFLFDLLITKKIKI